MLRKQSTEIINEVVMNATPEELGYILRKCSISPLFHAKKMLKFVKKHDLPSLGRSRAPEFSPLASKLHRSVDKSFLRWGGKHQGVNSIRDMAGRKLDEGLSMWRQGHNPTIMKLDAALEKIKQSNKMVEQRLQHK